MAIYDPVCIVHRIYDDTRETTKVWFLTGRHSSYRTINGLTEIRAGVQFECGDTFVTWLPVFTDWWAEC